MYRRADLTISSKGEAGDTCPPQGEEGQEINAHHTVSWRAKKGWPYYDAEEEEEPLRELKPLTLGASPLGLLGVELMSPLSLRMGITLSEGLLLLLLL